MHKKDRNHLRYIVAIAAMTGAVGAQAQSSDALIDKLVQKGILTTSEAKELREESDKDFTQAFQSKTGMPDWVTSMKFSGDFRGRFEQNNSSNKEYWERDRFRYRLRFGALASLGEQIDVGFRFASGNPQTNPGGALVGGAPITANQDLNSLESRKFLWIDAAYAKWAPLSSGDFTFSTTIGKMDNPFTLSNMIYDYDINPEGAAIQSTYRLNDQHLLKFNGAFFVLDELNQPSNVPAAVRPSTSVSSDPYIYGAQILFESKWTPKIESSLGAAVFDIANKDSLNSGIQPYYNSGSSRTATGSLRYNMNPIIGTGSVTYHLDSFPIYPDKFPIKLSGEYMYNPGAPANNVGYRAGLTLGKAGKKKAWEISYRYQVLEADAWFDAMVDDDNGGYYMTGNTQLTGTGKSAGWFGGTNVRGHQAQFVYNFTDFWNFAFTYYQNELILPSPGPSSAGHFMADVMFKF